jgi:hypothetical protein
MSLVAATTEAHWLDHVVGGRRRSTLDGQVGGDGRRSTLQYFTAKHLSEELAAVIEHFIVFPIFLQRKKYTRGGTCTDCPAHRVHLVHHPKR